MREKHQQSTMTQTDKKPTNLILKLKPSPFHLASGSPEPDPDPGNGSSAIELHDEESNPRNENEAWIERFQTQTLFSDQSPPEVDEEPEVGEEPEVDEEPEGGIDFVKNFIPSEAHPVDKENPLLDLEELRAIEKMHPELYDVYTKLNDQINLNAVCTISGQTLARCSVRPVATKIRDQDVTNANLVYLYPQENHLEYALLDAQGEIQRREIPHTFYQEHNDFQALIQQAIAEGKQIIPQRVEQIFLATLDKLSFQNNQIQKTLLIKQIKLNDTTWEWKDPTWLLSMDTLKKLFEKKQQNPFNRDKIDNNGNIIQGLKPNEEGRYIVWLIEEEQDQEGKNYTNYFPMRKIIQEIRDKLKRNTQISQERHPDLAFFPPSSKKVVEENSLKPMVKKD